MSSARCQTKAKLLALEQGLRRTSMMQGQRSFQKGVQVHRLRPSTPAFTPSRLPVQALLLSPLRAFSTAPLRGFRPSRVLLSPSSFWCPIMPLLDVFWACFKKVKLLRELATLPAATLGKVGPASCLGSTMELTLLTRAQTGKLLTFLSPAAALGKVDPAPRLGSTVELTLLAEVWCFPLLPARKNADAPSLPTCAASRVRLTTAKQLRQLLFWLAPLPLAPRVSSSSSPARSRLPSLCLCVDAAAKSFICDRKTPKVLLTWAEEFGIQLQFRQRLGLASEQKRRPKKHVNGFGQQDSLSMLSFLKDEDSEEEEQCTISSHWAFEQESKCGSPMGSSGLLAPPTSSLLGTSSCESVLTEISAASLPAISVSRSPESSDLSLIDRVPSPSNRSFLRPSQGQEGSQDKVKKHYSRSFLKHLESLRKKEKGDSQQTEPEKRLTTSEKATKASSFRSCRGFLSAGFYRAKNRATTSSRGRDGETQKAWEAWPIATLRHPQPVRRRDYLVHVPGDHKPGTFPRSLSIESLCPDDEHHLADWQPEGQSISDTAVSSSELDSSGNSMNEAEGAEALVGLQASVPRERRDSGVGASLTRPCRKLRWHSFQNSHRPSLNSESLEINRQFAGQINLLHKGSLLRLTGFMEKYTVPHKQAWVWSMPKFMKRNKTPDYRGHHVFGVPPLIHVQRTGQPLPQSIQQAMRYLRSQCLDQVGIFRKSGVKSRIQSLRQMNETSPDNVCYEGQSAYDVADLLKQYFRDLPEPIFTSKLTTTFLQIYQLLPKEQWLAAAQAATLLLPDENREVLQTLLYFLSDIASAEENQMTAGNLAVCLAPSIFHLNVSKKDSPSPSAAELSPPGPALAELRQAQAAGVSLSLYMEESVQELLRDAAERFKGWTNVPGPQHTELACRKAPDGHPLRMWKASTEVAAPPAVVLHRVLRERALWDEDLLRAQVLEALMPGVELYHYVTDSMAPHPCRDFVVLRMWRSDLPRGGCLLVSQSLDPEQPVPESGVRALMLTSQYLMEPCGLGRSRLTHICRADLRGRSPDWYNKVFGHLCAMEVAKIRDSFPTLQAAGPETKL
ncbi:START domain containing 8 [Cricetulus griseus]